MRPQPYTIKCVTLLFPKTSQFIQYNLALAITGAIRKTSKEKVYNKLVLEMLEKNMLPETVLLF